VSEFVTLDGVMEAPGGERSQPHSGWVFDFMGPILGARTSTLDTFDAQIGFVQAGAGEKRQ
jgi:hypothetical protein